MEHGISLCCKKRVKQNRLRGRRTASSHLYVDYKQQMKRTNKPETDSRREQTNGYEMEAGWGAGWDRGKHEEVQIDCYRSVTGCLHRLLHKD